MAGTWVTRQRSARFAQRRHEIDRRGAVSAWIDAAYSTDEERQQRQEEEEAVEEAVGELLGDASDDVQGS